MYRLRYELPPMRGHRPEAGYYGYGGGYGSGYGGGYGGGYGSGYGGGYGGYPGGGGFAAANPAATGTPTLLQPAGLRLALNGSTYGAQNNFNNSFGGGACPGSMSGGGYGGGGVQGRISGIRRLRRASARVHGGLFSTASIVRLGRARAQDQRRQPRHRSARGWPIRSTTR